MTILANEQTEGKGQRGHKWLSKPGENLLMSIIITPSLPIENQFFLSATIAVSVCETLNLYANDGLFKIKWPNDLFINDRKAGGILIENIIRGSQWLFAVMGIGINVLQTQFPESLPFATSLKRELNKELAIKGLAMTIRERLYQTLCLKNENIFHRYRQLLYKRDEVQSFAFKGKLFAATIKDILDTGYLVVEMEDGTIRQFNHGEVEWVKEIRNREM
jgi:BirA family biotin operon repressor/biotin-[acetyl-CoA-carboxylase] ligase